MEAARTNKQKDMTTKWMNSRRPRNCRQRPQSLRPTHHTAPRRHICRFRTRVLLDFALFRKPTSEAGRVAIVQGSFAITWRNQRLIGVVIMTNTAEGSTCRVAYGRTD